MQLLRHSLYQAGLIAFLAVGLYSASYHNFLLFHTITELFSVCIMWALFFLVWNTRRITDNYAVLFLGIAFVFVGWVDILHTLTYKGMQVFPENRANLPTQLWIAGRYLQSFSLLAAPFLVNRPFKPLNAMLLLAVTTTLLVASVFSGIFPDCFLEDTGLTAFKKGSEYFICVILTAAMVLFYRRRERFDPQILQLVLLSIGASIVSELFFTFYVSVFGLSNLIGHYLKVMAMLFLYRALVEAAISKPFNLLFRDLKEREQVLRESEARLRFALETCHIGAWDLDLVDHTAYRSMEHSRIFGYAEPLPQWTFEMFLQHVLPEYRAEAEAMVREGTAAKTGWSYECRIRRADGEIRWIWVSGRFVAGISGHSRVAGILQDITDRKLAEAALQESEALYRSIGESIDYGVWICAPDGRNTYASESFLKLVGMTQEQCSNFGWGNVLHPDDAERTIAAWQECVRTGGKWDIEHRFHGTDGQWHPVLARGVPVRNEQGEITRWAGINLDISRIKQAEELIKASLAEKEVLLKEVHHRVKNNLAAIMGLLDLQGHKMGDATAKAALVELSGRIRSMALVHQQLYKSDNFSRINFQDYIQALITHLSLSYERSANFRVSVAAKDIVMGLDNAVPCGLLLTELVTNAFKYAFPEGRPHRPGADICEIAVSAEWDGAAYTLTVADNGVGMPVDLDWTNTDTMGLLLVKMLGEHQLQGRIELDHSCGTSFRLRFEPRINDERRMMREE